MATLSELLAIKRRPEVRAHLFHRDGSDDWLVGEKCRVWTYIGLYIGVGIPMENLSNDYTILLYFEDIEQVHAFAPSSVFPVLDDDVPLLPLKEPSAKVDYVQARLL